MGFHEVQIPATISYGSSGGPGFRTDLIKVDSGAEYRVARWASAQRRYNVAYSLQDDADLATLLDFYIARKGVANGFRFKDWRDFTTAADHRSAPAYDDIEIGVGDNSETEFQLKTLYAAGTSYEVSRNITKPVSGTVVVGLGGTPQASGWSVDTTTGLITFSAAPGVGVSVTAGCEFDVPVRFGEELDALFDISWDAFETGSINDIPLVEIKDTGPISEDEFYGGAKDHGQIGASVSLSIADGKVQTFEPTTTGIKAYLPSPTSLQLGGPYFLIKNDSGTYSLEIAKDGGATSVRVLAAGEGCAVILGTNATSDKLWMAV